MLRDSLSASCVRRRSASHTHTPPRERCTSCAKRVDFLPFDASDTKSNSFVLKLTYNFFYFPNSPTKESITPSSHFTATTTSPFIHTLSCYSTLLSPPRTHSTLCLNHVPRADRFSLLFHLLYHLAGPARRLPPLERAPRACAPLCARAFLRIGLTWAAASSPRGRHPIVGHAGARRRCRQTSRRRPTFWCLERSACRPCRFGRGV